MGSGPRNAVSIVIDGRRLTARRRKTIRSYRPSILEKQPLDKTTATDLERRAIAARFISEEEIPF